MPYMSDAALRSAITRARRPCDWRDPDAPDDDEIDALEEMQRERDEDRAFWNHHGDTQ
jgi:hypothetical protein